MTTTIENPMVVADPGLEADEAAEAAELDNELRKTLALRDVDGFSEFLSNACAGNRGEAIAYLPHNPAKVDLSSKPIPRLLAYAMQGNTLQAGMAMVALVNRYLESLGVTP